MAGAVYILCMLTSMACAWLLLRAYARGKVRLLFWSGLCFVGLTIHNAFLIADLIVFRDVDLSIPRKLSSLAALTLLIYGLIWETRK